MPRYKYALRVHHEYDDLDTITEFAPSAVVGGLHDPQRLCFYDPARYKCALAGRQSGKSHLDAAWLLGGDGGQVSLYNARTIGKAWDIMFSVFHEMNELYDLGLRILKGDARVVEPNGHVIQLHGIKDMAAAEFLRGQRFRRVVIDEAGTYPDELLRYTVQTVLQPTLLKAGGELMLNGTPGIEPEGFFYELSGDPYSGVQGLWPTHHWTIYDNPHIPDKEQFILETLKANNWTSENPTFLREYMARWVADRGARVYDYHGHNEPAPTDGFTCIGVDFGYDPDKTAFVVLRMGNQPHIHCLKAYSLNHLTPHTIAEHLHRLIHEFHPNRIVADEGALGKGYAAELKEQFHLPIEAAEKRDKKARIELLRGIIAAGQWHMCAGSEPLADEWKVLPWGPERKDHHPKYLQDCSDAALYAASMMHQDNPYKAPVDTRREMEIQQAQMRERAMAQAARRWNVTRLQAQIERNMMIADQRHRLFKAAA